MSFQSIVIDSAEVNSVADPAAGAEFTFTLARAMEIIGVTFRFVSNATVAIRRCRLLFRNSAGLNVMFVSADNTQSESLTRDYFFQRDGQVQSRDSNILDILPLIILPRASTFVSTIQNLQGTDQISAIRIVAR